MKSYIFIILIISFNFLIGQEYDNLLIKQYIDQNSGIKELNKSVTQDNLNRDLFGSISAGDILVSDTKNVLFVLDDNWDRIVYGVQNSGEMKGFGNFGFGDGEFNRAQDIFVLNNGTIYVADTDNARIVKLSYNLTTEILSYTSSIDLAGWNPNRIAVNPNANNGQTTLFYIAAETNKLLLKYENGPLYMYPEDFSGSGVIETGAYALDYYPPYLFTIDEFDKEINVFSMNDANTDDPSILFNDVYQYPLPENFPGVIDLVIHESYPNDVAYIFDKKSVLNMRILTSSSSEINIPHVEDKSGAQFYYAKGISLKDEYGDVFIGEKWDDSHGGYWYALGPEIQEFEHSKIDYDNINCFEFTAPDRTIITTKIVKSDGNILTTLTNNETELPGKSTEYFNEYYNGSYIPYDTYTYQINAKSAFPHEGTSDDNEPVSEFTFGFEGGVLPVEGDIVSSTNYFRAGHSYTIKNHSNSKDFDPDPCYTDTWRVISTANDAAVTDLSESEAPYLAKYRATHFPGGGNLAKPATVITYTDEIGVQLSYSGQNSTEATRLFTVHRDDPEACPVLYIDDKPYVNLLPESPRVKGFVEDRITLPENILTADSLSLRIAESGNDVTTFKSVELVLEDVEKGTNLLRLSSGMSYEYKHKSNYSMKKPAKRMSTQYYAGDTLFLTLDQSGDAALSSTGYIIGSSSPINLCAYYDEGQAVESVYQVPPSGPDIFIDAAYARTFSYENNFFLNDTLSINGVREYYIIFHIDYYMDSLKVYYLEDNTTAPLAKSPVQSKYELMPKYQKISNNITLSGKKIPLLKPEEHIDFIFQLPKLRENYQRYAYLKVVGRYDPYNISDLSEKDAIPKEYCLYQNYPNPFNPSTKIRFAIPYESEVNITIFNILGQLINVIERRNLSPGIHEVVWDGANKNGDYVSSGLYLYLFEAVALNKENKRYNKSSKMILLR